MSDSEDATKNYVIDTNVFLSESQVLEKFSTDNNVIIPFKVIEELDNNKDRKDSVGVNARALIRKLDELSEEGSLEEGVSLDDRDGKISVKKFKEDLITLPKDLDTSKPDNIIIATAMLVDYHNPPDKTILVSRDICVRVKARNAGLNVEGYSDIKVIEDTKNLYDGSTTEFVSSDIIDKIYRDRKFELYSSDLDSDMNHNQFIQLKAGNGQQSVFLRFLEESKPLKVVNTDTQSAWGITPRNREQQYAVDLLFDNEVKLVSLIGKAGTGKTLLTLASAFEQIINKPSQYRKLVVARPTEPVGKDIGFLPGTFEEKIAPWMKPIKDNLEEFTQGPAGLDMFMSDNQIEIEAISYIRGRSISDSFIVIDEAQNCSVHELKTILTRAGEGSKIVLTGDIKQIDSTYIDETSNGLTNVVEKFKDQKIAGHCTLKKGERSELATIASEVM